MARRQQEGLHEVHETDEGQVHAEWSESGGNGGTVFEGVDTAYKTDGDLLAKKPKKTQEEKRADFARLASRRVSTAIDAIDSLIHLCAPQSYAWTAEDRMEIITTLHDRVSRVHDAFVSVEESGGKKTAKPLSFRLPV